MHATTNNKKNRTILFWYIIRFILTLLIIQKIVNYIKNWETYKEKRLVKNLNWDLKEVLLSKFAFEIIENNENLILPKDEVNKIVIAYIEELEANREIKKGIDKNNIINDLTLTGIITANEEGISFWHRAFLNYFASKEFAKKYIENSKIMDGYLNKSSLDYFKDTQIMRSTELTLIAYKKNLIHIHASAVKAVDALLYALKFKGCSISRDEIRDAKNLFQ